MSHTRRLVRVVCLIALVLCGGPFAASPAQTAPLAVAAPAAPADPVPQPGPGPTALGPAPGPGTAQPAPAPGPTPAPGPPPPQPARPKVPQPTAGPTPPACEVTHTDCSAGGGWGFGDLLDLPALITGAITSFLGTLIEQIMQPVRELLADTLLSTPDVTAQADIQRLWTGSLGIAAGIYVLFITAGGVTVMGYETVQTRYALKQIAPRLLFGMVAAATSLTVMGKAIALANALSQAVMGIDLSDAGQGLVERVVPFNLFGAAGARLYLLIIAVVVVVLILAVLLGYIVRVALMAVLAVAAPLALSCHAHPLTEAVARLWWRALAGCLAIQVAQSMTFIVALKLFFAPGATVLGLPKPSQFGTMLAGLALFWVLFKTPGWCMRLVFRSTPISTQLPVPLRMLQSVALWRLMNHYLPGAAGLRRRGGGGTGGRAGPSSG